MHGILTLLSLALTTYCTCWKSGDDDRRAYGTFFEVISGADKTEGASIQGMFHKSFHQCGMEESCKFVTKNIKTSEFNRIFDEKNLPNDRKNFIVWQKVAEMQIQVLSRFKPTVQSTTSYGWVSSRGVDEDKSTCTHTEKNSNEWWMVDLLKEAVVYKVAVTNRDYRPQRLRDFNIRVGNKRANATNQFCFEHARNVVSASTTSHKCTNSVRGRYLHIEQNVQDQSLTVCEVVVYGYYLN
eukprot:Seg1544.4 transcript_id=Seg1544.4/GoldUCD/mRNA.D3Y31 product=Fucolectin-5 protein_id=Seg1544.4/GoldUCD/D3Y31